MAQRADCCRARGNCRTDGAAVTRPRRPNLSARAHGECTERVGKGDRHMSESNEVRVAIVGVGNCAASLVQGVQYYQDADENSTVPGLMHVKFGQYHVRDVKFVAAFDVDAKKVGFDLSEAIFASEN